MSLSSAVQWWEEWQLRILVLASVAIQFLLLFFGYIRKLPTPSWLRTSIWLAYIGSDATTIYALATLFNRHRKQDCSCAQGSSVLEVLWAPILLMHLGGLDLITAYNIEDNELWKRHIVTSVSQVTVSIYVFFKSWPSDGDKRLLKAAILLFVPGVLKCIEKPWALKNASINSLVSYRRTVPRTGREQDQGDGISLESYVIQAKEIVLQTSATVLPTRRIVSSSLQAIRSIMQTYFPVRENYLPDNTYGSFVDLPLPYSSRLQFLKLLWALPHDKVHQLLARRLSDTFDHLYTKTNTYNINELRSFQQLASGCLRMAALYMPFAALGLFHKSHREGYNGDDVKVTYTLLCCTAVVEVYSYAYQRNTGFVWYKFSLRNLLRSYAGGGNKSCNSSSSITELVLEHVKSGWKDEIKDVVSYREFNDDRGQLALQRNNCDQEDLAWSLKVPFDESVLLWHLITDFCLARTVSTNEEAIQSTEISNYMMYLLFDNPEMLMPGTRRNLFTTAITELKGILEDQDVNLWLSIKSWIIMQYNYLSCKKLEEQDLAQKIIAKVESSEGNPSFIHDACALSKILLSLGDEKMWKVIQDVWVEMLCFSASRCRGYLHAKSLGTGGELLTYVWLLLLQMGMEPLAEKLQRVELPIGRGNGTAAAAPSSSDETLEERQQNTEVPGGEGNSDAAAPLFSEEILEERQQNTEGSSQHGRNISDVPLTSQAIVAIDIKEDNTFWEGAPLT